MKGLFLNELYWCVPLTLMFTTWLSSRVIVKPRNKRVNNCQTLTWVALLTKFVRTKPQHIIHNISCSILDCYSYLKLFNDSQQKYTEHILDIMMISAILMVHHSRSVYHVSSTMVSWILLMNHCNVIQGQQYVTKH